MTPEEKIIKPEKNQPVHIKKDGTVMVDIYDVGVKIAAGDTLVIQGSGEGVKMDVEPGIRFAPRLKIDTESPVVVDAPAFGVASGSTQMALVTTNQAELAGMQGLDSKRNVSNPDKSKDAPRQIPSYEISASDKHFGMNQAKAGGPTRFGNFSAGAAIVTLGERKEKREIIVEEGARVDFVNPLDRGNHMLTVQGSDTPEDRANRFSIFATGALASVKDTLDITKPQKENPFKRDKAKYGIPVKAEKGMVETVSPGTVRLDVPATLPFSGINPFAAAATSAAGASSVGEPNSPARLLAVRDAIVNYVDTTQQGNVKLLNGDYDAQVPGGRELAESLESIKENAQKMVSDDGTKVDTKALKALHQELDTYEATTDMMQGKAHKWLHDKGKIPKGAEEDPSKWDTKNVPGYIYNKMNDFSDDIERIRNDLDDSEGLSRTRANSSRQSRMLDGRDGAGSHPFDGLDLPDMPKLPLSGAGIDPDVLDAKLPKIVEFLKGKSGGKGAA